MTDSYLQRSEPNETEYKTGPKFFKRKKNQIEAVRIAEDNLKDVAKWCGGEALRVESNNYVKAENQPALKIPSLGEPVTAWLGEWLVKDEDGRYSVMDNKEFTTEFEFDKDRQNFTLPQSNIQGARNGEA